MANGRSSTRRDQNVVANSRSRSHHRNSICKLFCGSRRRTEMKSNSMRVALALFAVCVCAALLSSVGVAVRAGSEIPVPSNVRITPPAPVFDDKERVAELVQRRERVAKSIGPQSFMILFSTEPRVYTHDVEYP